MAANGWNRVTIATAGVVCAVLLVVSIKTIMLSGSTVSLSGSENVNIGKLAELKIDFQEGDLSGRPSVWVIPSGQVKGILLFLHGCTHSAKSIMTFPEHRMVMRAAAGQHHLAVLAVSSLDRATGCWSSDYPPDINKDVQAVSEALKTFKSKFQLAQSLPLYAMGASSGGTFVTILGRSKSIELDAIAVYISPGSHEALLEKTPKMPPTIFVYMPKDKDFASASAIAYAQEVLKNEGTVTDVRVCHPYPFTTSDVSYKLGIKEASASLLLNKLKEEKALDVDGNVIVNPRSFSQRLPRLFDKALLEKIFGLDGAAHSLAQLSELLNAADGRHEMTVEHIEDVLLFFEKHAHH